MTNEAAHAESDLDVAAAAYFRSPDEAGKTRVIEAAEGFVRYFQKLYGGRVPVDDLRQTGMVGVLKALNQYDQTQGASFSTYAGHLIIGEIRHLVRSEMSYARSGVLSGLQMRINQVIDEEYQHSGEMPSVSLIAERLGVSRQTVSEVMQAGLVDLEDIDMTQIQSVTMRSFELPVEDRLLLEQIYSRLTSFQKRIWNMLFVRDQTQEQTARRLGLTQRKVSREKKKIERIARETGHDG